MIVEFNINFTCPPRVDKSLQEIARGGKVKNERQDTFNLPTVDTKAYTPVNNSTRIILMCNVVI